MHCKSFWRGVSEIKQTKRKTELTVIDYCTHKHVIDILLTNKTLPCMQAT